MICKRYKKLRCQYVDNEDFMKNNIKQTEESSQKALHKLNQHGARPNDQCNLNILNDKTTVMAFRTK